MLPPRRSKRAPYGAAKGARSSSPTFISNQEHYKHCNASSAMSSLAQAEWPSQPIPEQVKELLAKFYACVDSPLDPNSDLVLADKVFHTNGTLQFNKRHVRGTDEIAH
ncbi:hypothetical protein LTR95_007566 [Oleoguttula sp. CCFEE 5521]